MAKVKSLLKPKANLAAPPPPGVPQHRTPNPRSYVSCLSTWLEYASDGQFRCAIISNFLDFEWCEDHCCQSMWFSGFGRCAIVPLLKRNGNLFGFLVLGVVLLCCCSNASRRQCQPSICPHHPQFPFQLVVG